MIITIYDYSENATECQVRPIAEIESITLEVLSGDEILQVYYKDGTTENFDSSQDRMVDFFDGRYIIYDEDVNLLEDESWLASTNSYNRMDIAYE